MIETIAISIGTNASSEANTNASTGSAPTPPSSDSRKHPGPVAAAGLVLERVDARSHARARPRSCPLTTARAATFAACVLSPNELSSAAGIREHEGRPPVRGHECAVARSRRTTRSGSRAAPGGAWPRSGAAAADAGRGDRRAGGQRHDRQQGGVPAAVVVEREHLWLVTNPSRPGTENFLLNELTAVLTVATPTSVIRIHAIVTVRLWRQDPACDRGHHAVRPPLQRTSVFSAADGL